jgi:hypothetical protein
MSAGGGSFGPRSHRPLLPVLAESSCIDACGVLRQTDSSLVRHGPCTGPGTALLRQGHVSPCDCEPDAFSVLPNSDVYGGVGHGLQSFTPVPPSPQ